MKRGRFRVWGRRLQRTLTSGHFGLGVMAVVVGGAGGGAAILFTHLIGWIHQLSFGTLGRPLGFLGGAYVILIPAVGGLIVGALVHRFAREAKGHGVPEVMLAVTLKGGRIPFRVALVKTLASSLTIGTGGSVGREGPIVQIGSSLASALAQLFRLSAANIRLMVACGAAAGVSATFNAPIAGAIFASEVILREFDVPSFTGIVISSVTAAVISRSVLGDFPSFQIPAHVLVSPAEIPLYLVLGLLCAFVAVGFTRLLYLMEDAFDKIPRIPVPVKAAMGGLLIGIIGWKFPQIFGVGYETVTQALHGKMLFGILAGLVLLKVLATSITIGSGGSGGVFAPSLFIGAMLGGAFGSVVHSWWPATTAGSGAYATVGMGALFAGAARAPVTAILIIFEMTQDYKMILPIMTGVVVSSLVARLIMRDSIYTLKLRRRGLDIEAKRPHNIMDYVLAHQVMRRNFDIVGPDLPIAELLKMFKKSKLGAFPIVDPEGKLIGITTFQEVTQALDLVQKGKVRDLPASEWIPCYPDQTLSEVMRLVAGRDIGYLPVVDPTDDRKVLGVLSRHDMMRAISSVTLEEVQHMEARGGGRTEEELRILPVEVEAGGVLAGRLIKDLGLPMDMLLTSIRRKGRLLIPRGTSRLEPGDRLAIQIPKGKEEGFRRFLKEGPAEVRPADELRTATVDVESGSPFAGKRVQDLGLPVDVLLTSIRRRGKLIMPRGRTAVEAGDQLSVQFPRAAEPEFQAFLKGEEVKRRRGAGETQGFEGPAV